MSGSTRRLSLQFLFIFSIVFLMLLTSGIFIYQGMRGSETALVSAAGESARQLSATLNERIRRLLEPAESTLRLLSFDSISAATSMPERLGRLQVFSEVVANNPMIGAVYVGYPDGEFFLLRKLATEKQRNYFSAPADSAYIVQSRSLQPDDNIIGEWRFYDRNLRLLDRWQMSTYQFDPRSRPWYMRASESNDVTLTPPYVFFSTHEIGVTLARRSADGLAVIGMDASVSDLSAEMRSLQMTPNTRIAVIADDGKVMAYPQIEEHLQRSRSDISLPMVQQLNAPALEYLYNNPPTKTGPQSFSVNGTDWFGVVEPLTAVHGNHSSVYISLPANELLAQTRSLMISNLKLTALMAVVLILIGWILGHRLTRPLQRLTDQIQALTEFNFGSHTRINTRLKEVHELSGVIDKMTATIRNFLAITHVLSQETRIEAMLEKVLRRLVAATGLSGGAVYLWNEQENCFVLAGTTAVSDCPTRIHAQQQPDGSVTRNERLLSDQLPASDSWHEVVLRNREQELLGVVALKVPAEMQHTDKADFHYFINEMTGVVAIAIDTRQLIESQEQLLEAIIKLLADAIDAKSPHTSGHCQRVPELAILLSDRASRSQQPRFRHFSMSEADRTVFRIAAWLHDCGKITSPEYVVDKATKLETLYNRIHEVRTRFEVLWRDAELDYWRGIASGEPETLMQDQLHARQQQLQEDFAFIANTNIGGEFLDEEAVVRIQQIGDQLWVRHFDDRLGLSQEERERYDRIPHPALPATEQLLADKPDHIFHWHGRRPPVEHDNPANRWGFDMRAPEVAYNLGERYNLGIRRGTLTEEERFKINEHIVQTIIMLDALPWPRPLRDVPRIAGSHHERLDGNGYPRRLTSPQMSVQEKVLAIADVFEALTAADRPYKPAKPLSESIRILFFMARDQHLDPSLLHLFLESGVYLEYAHRFLKPEQIDEVDIPGYLQKLEELLGVSV
ncbi:hypothetical protein WH50_25395 [Pokkaliibacter plantistimulans]|uniref:Phosphohydrolase n=1 Tax=Pokkaliibacter plantistimulans TaxID=1635171 RepID=A0ABX5LSX7_9GAMM|nr:HD domain-containing phosphohydrolase [Pokkaliibacter plantistimulans]PXF28608.1 hypothetical protein WH50_25395 [Pokkaliibacter plantistimulans]